MRRILTQVNKGCNLLEKLDSIRLENFFSNHNGRVGYRKKANIHMLDKRKFL
jgi:hypothetical protein